MKYSPLIFLLLLIGCKKNNSQFDEIEGELINLRGTSWELYQSNEIPSIKENGRNFPIIGFGVDGFAVESSCNRMGGEMVLTSSSFTFEGFITTYLACNEEQQRLEAYFYKLVDNRIFYKYSKGTLYLFNGDKVIGLFKREK